MQEGTQLTGNGIVQDKEMQDQQHIAETENENEEEVRAHEERQIEDDTADTQILREQSDNEHKIAEVAKVEHNTGKNTDQETTDIYPGASS
eukprot:4665276-Heterocapsa_arctica.AAC.1